MAFEHIIQIPLTQPDTQYDIWMIFCKDYRFWFDQQNVIIKKIEIKKYLWSKKVSTIVLSNDKLLGVSSTLNGIWNTLHFAITQNLTPNPVYIWSKKVSSYNYSI